MKWPNRPSMRRKKIKCRNRLRISQTIISISLPTFFFLLMKMRFLTWSSREGASARGFYSNLPDAVCAQPGIERGFTVLLWIRDGQARISWSYWMRPNSLGVFATLLLFISQAVEQTGDGQKSIAPSSCAFQTSLKKNPLSTDALANYFLFSLVGLFPLS